MKRIRIQGGWFGLWYAIRARNGRGWEIFLDMVNHYSESHRHYHDFTHLLQMFQEFKEVKHLCRNPLAVEMFIWRHDYIYHPVARDNEERSAQETRAMLESARLPKSYIDEVCRLILLSKKHSTEEEDSDGALALDIDLSIWGQSASVFDTYEKNICKEYVEKAKVLEEVYRIKRIEYLENFLNPKIRASIYLSPYFREKYEISARENLVRSIAQLKNKMR